MLLQQIAHDCRTEIVELHRFFVEWFTGVVPDSDATWSAFEDALAPRFLLVTPDGEAIGRSALLAALRPRHGTHAPGAFRIWIEAFDCRRVDGDLVLATYEEWQDAAGEPRGRRSTAVFERNAAMPNHVRWLHVHETWLPARKG